MQMQGRLDALIRAQTVPRPLQDLLTLLVAHCLDSDAFKQSSVARLGVLEGLVHMPTNEISNARAATVAALDDMQRNVAALEARFRKTYDDLQREATLRLEQLTALARDAAGETEKFRQSARDEFEMQIQQHREELQRTAAIEIAKAKEALIATTDVSLSNFSRRAHGIAVNAIEEVSTHATEAFNDVRSQLSESQHGVGAIVQRLVSDAELTLKTGARAATDFVATALDTVNALPLLECHRLSSTVALLETRLDIASGVSEHSQALPGQLSALSTRLQRLELLAVQCNDRIDALQGGASGRPETLSMRAVLSQSASAAASPPSSPLSRPATYHHHGNTAAAPRQPPNAVAVSSYSTSLREALANADADHNYASFAPTRNGSHHPSHNPFASPKPSTALRDAPPSSTTKYSTGSPGGALESTTIAAAAGPSSSSSNLLLRLQARLDAAEVAVFDATALARDAVAGVKALGAMVDERLIAPLETLADRSNAALYMFGIEPDAAVQLYQRHAAHNTELAVTLSAAEAKDELRRAALMQLAECTQHVLSQAPVFKLLRPLPPLGLELGDGAPPFGGVVVLSVVPGGAAERAGLQTEDIVMRAGDVRVASRAELHFALSTWPTRRAIPHGGGHHANHSTAAAVVHLAVYRPVHGVLLDVSIAV